MGKTVKTLREHEVLAKALIHRGTEFDVIATPEIEVAGFSKHTVVWLFRANPAIGHPYRCFRRLISRIV
jgi:hypothetical protein